MCARMLQAFLHASRTVEKLSKVCCRVLYQHTKYLSTEQSSTYSGSCAQLTQNWHTGCVPLAQRVSHVCSLSTSVLPSSPYYHIQNHEQPFVYLQLCMIGASAAEKVCIVVMHRCPRASNTLPVHPGYRILSHEPLAWHRHGWYMYIRSEDVTSAPAVTSSAGCLAPTQSQRRALMCLRFCDNCWNIASGCAHTHER